MQLMAEQVNGRVPVTILSVHGSLDASNFEELIAKGRELYATGTRHLLLDLAAMPFMGSSGLVALQSIALLLRGEAPPDLEQGWQAFHTLGPGDKSGAHPNIKLLGPQPKIERTLQVTGMSEFFEIHTDRQTAIDSF